MPFCLKSYWPVHGRLKVKTTAEQEDAKRVEREKKVQKYTAVTQQIVQKRNNGEKDQSVIELTGLLLASNPDFYSLWNYRREVYKDWTQNRSHDEMQEVLTNELRFIEQCLQVNPKSYGSWHQRCWVMDIIPDPNWAHELGLCNKYLEYDERNFHCWDYRRFVVQRHNILPEAEFDFTTDKISNNFSNYSSWHYRSKLLPLIHPDPHHPVGVREDILLKEFELAQNAFFTDPNDQSAWFYHRWLLGRDERPVGVLCAVVDRTLGRLVLSLTRYHKEKVLPVCVKIDGKDVAVRLNAIGPQPFSKIWEGDLNRDVLSEDTDHVIEVELPTIQCTLQLKLCRSDSDVVWRKKFASGNTFSCDLSAATADVLSQELDACNQLHELEPDNKWTMFTIVLLMRALDPLKYTTETMTFLTKLENIDGTRKNYYQDLRSKFIIENALEELAGSSRSIDLSNRGLTAVYHLEYMTHLENIDFSNNSLTIIKDLHYLQCVKVLNVTRNPAVLSQCDKKLLRKLKQ